MPGKVLLLVLALGTPGVVSQNNVSKVTFLPFLHMYERSVGSTIFVGFSGGKPFSHRQVVLRCGSPNSYGCMICVGFFHADDIMPTGFSTAMRGQLARAISMKRTMLRCCRPSFCFCSKCRAPETARSVQGGCAMMRSHAPVCVCVEVARHKPAIAIEKRQHISADMPLWMSTAALLQIAAKSAMTESAKRLADFLRFLTRDEYVHHSPQ